MMGLIPKCHKVSRKLQPPLHYAENRPQGVCPQAACRGQQEKNMFWRLGLQPSGQNTHLACKKPRAPPPCFWKPGMGTLERWRQEDQDFTVTLGCILGSRLAWPT